MADRLGEIFERQTEMIKKYMDIEALNGFHKKVQSIPVDLNDRFGQARLKDTAWRITEEMGESLSSYSNREEFQEEMSDVLHFMAEFTILSGITHDELTEYYIKGKGDTLDQMFRAYKLPSSLSVLGEETILRLCVSHFISSLAMTCNLLKNKPWKQTSVQTNVDDFRSSVGFTWAWFIRVCQAAGMTPDMLYEGYFAKSKVNQKRQQTGY